MVVAAAAYPTLTPSSLPNDWFSPRSRCYVSVHNSIRRGAVATLMLLPQRPEAEPADPNAGRYQAWKTTTRMRCMFYFSTALKIYILLLLLDASDKTGDPNFYTRVILAYLQESIGFQWPIFKGLIFKGSIDYCKSVSPSPCSAMVSQT